MPSPTGPPAHGSKPRVVAIGIEVEVDHAIELPHGDFDRVRQLLEVEALPSPTMAREVDRAEVAHGGLAAARHLEDLGAQVRQVHGVAGLGGLVAGAVATCP